MKIKKLDIFSLVNLFIIILLVGLITNILFFKIKKETFINDLNNSQEDNRQKLAEIVLAINKENYQKYLEEKKKIIKDDFQIGYSKVPGVSEESLGFCPIGQYYKGKFTNNPVDVLSKCKECYKCSEEGQGYYTMKGCMGDKDSVCKHGRVPYQTFIDIHQKPYLLHSQLPQHKHRFDFDKKENYNYGRELNEFNYQLSNGVHQHPF